MTPTLETQARELVEKIRKATLVLVPEQVQPPIIKWATSDPVALLLDALSAAHAEGARHNTGIYGPSRGSTSANDDSGSLGSSGTGAPEARRHAELPDAVSVKMLQNENAVLTRRLDACAPYLKDGETPAQCIERNRADIDMLLGLLAAEKQKTEGAEVQGAPSPASELKRERDEHYERRCQAENRAKAAEDYAQRAAAALARERKALRVCEEGRLSALRHIARLEQQFEALEALMREMLVLSAEAVRCLKLACDCGERRICRDCNAALDLQEKADALDAILKGER